MVYELIITGLVLVDDNELITLYMKRFVDDHNFGRDPHYILNWTGTGIAERGNIELLEEYIAEHEDVLQESISKGISRNGNIGLFNWWINQDSDIFRNYIYQILQNAALFGNIDIIKFIINTYGNQLILVNLVSIQYVTRARDVATFIDYLIKNNDSKDVIELLETLSRLNNHFKNLYKDDIIAATMESGSFELLHYLLNNFAVGVSNYYQSATLLRNHTDMYAYLYRLGLENVNIYLSTYNLSPVTVEVLLKNNLITKKTITSILTKSEVMTAKNKKFIGEILQRY